MIGILTKGVAAIMTIANPTPLMQPDRDAWPGDALSEQQVKTAIAKFAGTYPWEWVLIGPGDWLLAGTSYRVIVRNDAPIPNISITRGYWGGEPHTGTTLGACKRLAEQRAADDAASGIQMTGLLR